jgi:hypothetical protein
VVGPVAHANPGSGGQRLDEPTVEMSAPPAQRVFAHDGLPVRVGRRERSSRASAASSVAWTRRVDAGDLARPGHPRRARGVRLMRRHRLPASVRAERVMSFPEEGPHPGPGSAGSSAIPPGERRPSSRRGATPDSKDSRRSSARHSPMPVTCPSSPCPCGPAARVMRSPGKRPSPASWSVSSSPSTPGATCGPVPAGAGTAGRGDVAPAAIDATRAARYRRPSRRRVHGPLGTAVAP